jgi:hypothetical protein
VTINNNGTHTGKPSPPLQFKRQAFAYSRISRLFGLQGSGQKYWVQSHQMMDWKKKREDILEKEAEMKYVTSKHQFLLKMSCHEGRKTETAIAELKCAKGVYEDISNMDRVATLLLLAHDLLLNNVSLHDLIVQAVRRRVY